MFGILIVGVYRFLLVDLKLRGVVSGLFLDVSLEDFVFFYLVIV